MAEQSLLSFKKGGSEVEKRGGCTLTKIIRKIVEAKGVCNVKQGLRVGGTMVVGIGFGIRHKEHVLLCIIPNLRGLWVSGLGLGTKEHSASALRGFRVQGLGTQNMKRTAGRKRVEGSVDGASHCALS